MDQLRAEDPAFIGPYRLAGRLGAGGMGIVYRAEAPDGQAVAVKLVRADAAADEEFRRRFAREVRAARLVGDAWTARVLDADTDADVPWVATEYVPGPSLRAAVEGRLGPLPAASVFVLAHRLALALRAIHGAGLIHRDLKPSNILLTVGGPRVIDFGIARRAVLSSESDLTRTGVLVGSPEFMSPEQVRGDEVTPAGDVFSLGAVLAYASTGRAPFSTGDPGVHGLLFRVAYEDPDVAGVPETVAELVHDCLRKDPADRPTVDALVSRTRKALDGSWLPPELLARLDEDAADFLRATPAPVRDRGPATAPVRVRVTRSVTVPVPVLPGVLRVGRRLLTALVVGAATVAYAGVGPAPSFARPSDGTQDAKPFTGVWRVESFTEEDPFLMRLEIRNATRLGRPAGTFVSATSTTVCQGELGLTSRSSSVMVVSGFRVSRSTPPGASAEECGLPDHLTLGEQSPADGFLWRENGSTTTPVGRSWAPKPDVPEKFWNVWSSGDGLVVSIRPGGLGDLVVRTVRTVSGRHCESTAALLSVDGGVVSTTPSVLDAAASESACVADGIAWTYRTDPRNPSVLIREHDSAARRLRLVS
ncbi:serine/threonine-protein kinase [Streptomyces sp. SS]|uniref:serine/threonine-protein kinase n=1 Tax=Streptomyces sp. SS TaxID=260742 RepID=UPI0002EAF399|nr:serine/threonine-protein kinase [Streptomyces sp. SS]